MCFVLFYAVLEFFGYVNIKVVVMGNSAYGVPFFPFVFFVHGECYHPVYVISVRYCILFHRVVRHIVSGNVRCCGFPVYVDG